MADAHKLTDGHEVPGAPLPASFLSISLNFSTDHDGLIQPLVTSCISKVVYLCGMQAGQDDIQIHLSKVGRQAAACCSRLAFTQKGQWSKSLGTDCKAVEAITRKVDEILQLGRSCLLEGSATC